MKLFSNKRVQSSRHLSDLDGQFSQLSWEVQVLPSCTPGKAVSFWHHAQSPCPCSHLVNFSAAGHVNEIFLS